MEAKLWGAWTIRRNATGFIWTCWNWWGLWWFLEISVLLEDLFHQINHFAISVNFLPVGRLSEESFFARVIVYFVVCVGVGQCR